MSKYLIRQNIVDPTIAALAMALSTCSGLLTMWQTPGIVSRTEWHISSKSENRKVSTGALEIVRIAYSCPTVLPKKEPTHHFHWQGNSILSAKIPDGWKNVYEEWQIYRLPDWVTEMSPASAAFRVYYPTPWSSSSQAQLASSGRSSSDKHSLIPPLRPSRPSPAARLPCRWTQGPALIQQSSSPSFARILETIQRVWSKILPVPTPASGITNILLSNTVHFSDWPVSQAHCHHTVPTENHTMGGSTEDLLRLHGDGTWNHRTAAARFSMQAPPLHLYQWRQKWTGPKQETLGVGWLLLDEGKLSLPVSLDSRAE